jgi:hypothetical protein
MANDEKNTKFQTQKSGADLWEAYRFSQASVLFNSGKQIVPQSLGNINIY